MERLRGVQAAHAAGRTKGAYLSAQYRGRTTRRGRNKAAIAVGHTLLVVIYHMIQQDPAYEDLGPQHFDQRDRHVIEHRLVQRLEGLGYTVVLAPRVAA